MPYAQTTLDDLAIQCGVLLDDQQELYWTRAEKYLAIYEALRVWGAYTSYWRTRTPAFNLTPGQPYYDLSSLAPTLRSRSWTVQQMVQDIQYMCLEAANGISGVGMSGQISILSIIEAVSRARNRFCLDAHIPFSVLLTPPAPPPSQGSVELGDDTIYVHRASWQDIPSLVYTNLWRQDSWSFDKTDILWTLQPGQPIAYSESENAPLGIQLYPVPVNEGALELITVESIDLNSPGPATTFNVPDEWVHAVKYAALSDLFSAESQNKDPLRAQYAEMRYQQAIVGARSIRSIMRLLLNNMPLPIDGFAALDASLPFWRNQSGMPQVAGVLSDFLAFGPVPDQAYGATADVVAAAPLPAAGADFIQAGQEELNNLLDYASHILTFKCGGEEFKETFSQYDGFMKAAGDRGLINKAKIQYTAAVFGQAQKSEGARPDMEEEVKRA